MQDIEMAYKYQYNPAATDNVSLHDNSRGRSAAGSLTYSRSNRMRHSEEEEASLGRKCCFGFLFIIAQILLHGSLTLLLFWICVMKWSPSEQYPTPFFWQGSTKQELELTWNLHPFLMMAGFIYFMGQGMLVYRTGTCCRRIYTKLIHTMFHLLAIPCVAIGFMGVWYYKSLRKDDNGAPNPVPHFYSIHSWLGLATMGLFALQLVVGMFSFLALLACESATARFRAKLVPVHAIIGTATFILAIATCVCGLNEKAFLDLGTGYPNWINEIERLHDIPISQNVPIFLNVISACLGALAIVMPLILFYPKFRFRTEIA